MLDLGIDLNLWPWVWLGIAVFFALIELTVLAGSFVLLPFAVSALGAALLGFYDVAIEIQWLMFLGGGAVIWILLYRYAKTIRRPERTPTRCRRRSPDRPHRHRHLGHRPRRHRPPRSRHRPRRDMGRHFRERSATPARHPRPHRRRQRHQGHRPVDRRRAADHPTSRPTRCAAAGPTAQFIIPTSATHLVRPPSRELP